MQIAQEATTSFRSTARRPGPLGLLGQAFREVSSRRRLIRYLVQADLKKKGANTVLGNLWWVLDPILSMAVYLILVTVIFQRTTPGYPLFLFSAILPWKWFTSSVQDAISSVTGQERLIKQIHFPKLVLPVASTTAGIANFAFGLIPLSVLLFLFFRDRASVYLVLIPAVAVVQFLFTLACAFACAAINVFYRDVGNVIRHALRLLFYLSPALYSVDQIHKIAGREPIVGHIMAVNPFAILFESYRDVIYVGQGPHWRGLLELTIASLILLAITTYIFKRVEPSFAKVL